MGDPTLFSSWEERYSPTKPKGSCANAAGETRLKSQVSAPVIS
jgi:hypothetical protein